MFLQNEYYLLVFLNLLHELVRLDPLHPQDRLQLLVPNQINTIRQPTVDSFNRIKKPKPIFDKLLHLNPLFISNIDRLERLRKQL
jgi:hypothetical protein